MAEPFGHNNMSVSSGPGRPRVSVSLYSCCCDLRSDFPEGFYENIVCPACNRIAGQLKLYSRWYCCRRVICHIRVRDLWGDFWGDEWVYTFARPWLYAVNNRRWAIDLVEHLRTCCDRKKHRWPSYWCGWGPCYWCGWWEWQPRIVARIGRHPLCSWCYD